MVVISARSATFSILVMQALFAFPSTMTVQVPQWPSLQQTLQPVSIRLFLSTSAKVISGETTSQRSKPLMLNNLRFKLMTTSPLFEY